MQTLGEFFRTGEIRYYALSAMPLWLAMKAATIAAERRNSSLIAMQGEYSLVARDVGSEHISAAQEAGKGGIPWSPLAKGFFTGKYYLRRTWLKRKSAVRDLHSDRTA